MTSLKQKIPKKLRVLYLLHGGLFIAFLILFCVGTVNILSAASAATDLGIVPFERHLEVAFGGLVFGGFMYWRDYAWWRKYIWLLFIGTVLLLIAVKLGGIEINGAKRWLALGPLQFQPSELAKLTGICWASTVLAMGFAEKKSGDLLPYIDTWRDKAPWKRYAAWICPHKALWIPIIMSGLVMFQPDAGTSIVIMLMPLIMIFVTGQHWKRLIPHAIVIVPGFIGYLASAPYRMDRFKAWFDPDSYATDIGYQIKQSMIAIGSGGIWGQGFGEGISKFQYLPEAHTDFAFAVLSQEGGFFVALCVIGAFLLIAFCGIMTALRCKRPFGMFLALGITIYFCGQGFINMAMVCDLLPVVGVPLPFISYGGTALIMNFIAAALLLNVARTNIKDMHNVYWAKQDLALVSKQDQ